MTIFSDNIVTCGEIQEFLINEFFFGRKAVRTISRTETIKIPLIMPETPPNKWSTQFKNVILRRYFMIVPTILIIINTRKKIVKKLVI